MPAALGMVVVGPQLVGVHPHPVDGAVGADAGGDFRAPGILGGALGGQQGEQIELAQPVAAPGRPGRTRRSGRAKDDACAGARVAELPTSVDGETSATLKKSVLLNFRQGVEKRPARRGKEALHQKLKGATL